MLMKHNYSSKYMKNIKSVIFTLFIIILVLTLSWAITIGLVKLICICFSLDFSLKIATGVWLVLCLIRPVFSSEKR